MQLHGCDTDCPIHTITVSSPHIKICCFETDRLITLTLDGIVKSVHGPEIDVIDDSSEAASRDGTVKRWLSNPYLCQEDDDGNLLITDGVNDRLLLFTAECKWHDVTPVGGLKWPRGALWLNRRLYIGNIDDSCITMFEWSHAQCMFGKHSDCQCEVY